MRINIMVVEDEESIRKFIKINLDREGYAVYEASSGEEALEIVKNEQIDIAILDVMLPGIDGFEVLKELRIKYPKMGIIMLTAKSQDTDKIMGLEYGSDDYMTKPFNPAELILRIKSLIRRLDFDSDNKNILEFGPFKLDLSSREFYKNNVKIELTRTEFAIIDLFMSNPGKAFDRDQILDIIWGVDFSGDGKVVDVNIRRLRSKIEEDPSKPIYIETIWGIGYRWREED
ncbi:response regulator transcription factor [Soehngenia longivitae]|uniref:Response regulator transcription factor n=1 Tax=Soehngenia longivitae TaxID=2562294 RepID=A0A4Z0D735_9FIRM|nr:response regulator transcription factor [Soehngenia longivitae]TFZ40701.1 response regulator transcription factor [Soehngenia longivitae]